MRISDWSSDVCSSDLIVPGVTPMRLLPACLLLLAAMPAVATDLILHNGLVWTGDPARPSASALAIEDGRITAVGDDATILALAGPDTRSEEHTSELQSLMRISYAVFCLKKKKKT